MNMMMILGLTPLTMSAQIQLDRHVVSTAGSDAGGSTLLVSYTIGEMMTIVGASADLLVTQGFQQPEEQLTVGITDNQTGSSGSIHVYPNPVIDMLTIDLQAFDEPSSLDIRAADGALVWHGTLPKNDRVSIPFHQFPAGTYLLTITSVQNRQESWRVIKAE